MTRPILALRSRGLLVAAVAVLALVVGVVGMSPDAHACTAGCVDSNYDPDRGYRCGAGGAVWCQICTFCY